MESELSVSCNSNDHVFSSRMPCAKLSLFVGAGICERAHGILRLKLLCGYYLNAHLADSIHPGEEDITRAHRADALRRARQNDVAGMQGVERRCELDQLLDAEHEVVGVGVLPDLAIYRDAEGKSRWVIELIGSHHPGTQHCVGVGRFAEAALLRAADGNIQSNAVAGCMIECVRR